MIGLKHPDDRLLSFYQDMTLESLRLQMQYLQKYQQSILINAYGRKQPLERYTNQFLSSQSHLLIMLEIMLEKASKGENESGEEKGDNSDKT